MPVTSRFYGGSSMGANRTIQDFGLCDLKGGYVYSYQTRRKGILVVSFFSPDVPASVRAIEAVQAWSNDVPQEKWAALALSGADRDSLQIFAEKHGIDKVTLLLDYEFYQTRTWGVSQFPSTFVISGKTGRVLDRVVGDDPAELDRLRTLIASETVKIVAAEKAAAEAAAAKKAEDEKKAAEAAKATDTKK